MAITILPPVVEDLGPYHAESDESMSDASDSDVEMGGVSRPHKRARLGGKKLGTGIVTPGEVVTDDPQWMRWVYPTWQGTMTSEGIGNDRGYEQR